MSKRRSLVSANWKMNGSLDSIRQLVSVISQGVSQGTESEVIICPPSLYISELAGMLKETNIGLGAQNVSHLECGAHTGEVAPIMLKDFACKYVIVGHSERRVFYGENDLRVAEKFVAVQANEMIPILCVGELLQERESDCTKEVISRQLDAVIELAGIVAMKEAVIAYEPVWAIGTGKTATPKQAQETHEFIRSRLARHDPEIADGIRILYGGSVKADNAKQLFELEDIDGGLIGGASLVADDFLTICHSMR